MHAAVVYRVPERRERCEIWGEKKNWRNNGSKFSKFDENWAHKPKNFNEPQAGWKHKKSYKAHYNQIAF